MISLVYGHVVFYSEIHQVQILVLAEPVLRSMEHLHLLFVLEIALVYRF